MFVRFVVYTILLYIIVEKCHHLLLVGAFGYRKFEFFFIFFDFDVLCLCCVLKQLNSCGLWGSCGTGKENFVVFFWVLCGTCVDLACVVQCHLIKKNNVKNKCVASTVGSMARRNLSVALTLVVLLVVLLVVVVVLLVVVVVVLLNRWWHVWGNWNAPSGHFAVH